MTQSLVNTILIIINLVLTTGLIVKNLSSNQVKVVDISQLYTEFELTKELDAKYLSISKKRLSLIDSFKNQHHTLESEFNTSTYENEKERLSSEIAMIQAKIREQEEIDTRIRIEFEQQVWNQLNTYMLEFGKEKPYQVILGTRNEGNVLFINESNNITSELIDFSNKKYLGDG